MTRDRAPQGTRAPSDDAPISADSFDVEGNLVGLKADPFPANALRDLVAHLLPARLRGLAVSSFSKNETTDQRVSSRISTITRSSPNGSELGRSTSISLLMRYISAASPPSKLATRAITTSSSSRRGRLFTHPLRCRPLELGQLLGRLSRTGFDGDRFSWVLRSRG